MATATHGSLAVFKLADSGAVLQDVTSYLTTNGLAKALDTVDVSHMGDTNKHYIPGLSDSTFDIGGNLDPTIDAQIAGIDRLLVNFEYYPLGDSGAAGTNVKYAGSCFISDYSISTPVNAAATFTAKAQVSGGVTRTLV